MGERSAARLISDVRKKSHNVRYGDNSGVQDREILNLLNDASRHISSKIFKTATPLYTSANNIDLTAGTALYTIPRLTYLGGAAVSVHYSETGTFTQDSYVKTLRGPISQEERVFYRGVPDAFYFEGGQIGFSPIPDRSVTSGIRITNRNSVRTLDVKRGLVWVSGGSKTVLNTSARTITALYMDTGSTPFDSGSEITNEDYICIVDFYGNFYMKNIPITAFNTTTGQITVESTFVYASGETAPSGSFIVSGFNASSHSAFSYDIDDYLVEFATLYTMGRDIDDLSFKMQQDKVRDRENDIILQHSDLKLTENFIHIPR